MPPLMPDTPPLPPAPQKSRTNAVIIGSAAAVISAVIATGVVVVQSGNDNNQPAVAESSVIESSSPAEDIATEATEEPEVVYDEPDVDSFTIELRTTERQCFGSAGCNLTIEPDLTYRSLGDLDPSVVYEITYQITGDENGPVIETAELTGTSLNYTPSVISTASASTKVTVEITDVRAQG
jgi:hypothetical protein